MEFFYENRRSESRLFNEQHLFLTEFVILKWLMQNLQLVHNTFRLLNNVIDIHRLKCFSIFENFK